ncbi:LuxR C-terminal-related transcriptional regulator [Ancylobacter sp. Lp-2]|uniref:helix-turn-helix transcriptional regulator n=1 Tax=Ancylobacter sp. Lp-2 TaxID=2881339 RepID=UPI001E658648|nr:LuxR C-terminal-related transcriptional regulator [Ancylobacter sp. Lp-2]MCB4771535.1 LuxR C-terminal-related transcriptional regulator [Ancylobacter sp. Lp-2]
MMCDVDADSWRTSIITTIQEAAISPELWDEVLASILVRSGAHVGFFLGLGNGNGHGNGNGGHGNGHAYGHGNGNGDGERVAIVARGASKATLLSPELIAFFDATTQSLGQGATFEVELRDVALRPEVGGLCGAFGDHGVLSGILIAREGPRRFALLLVHPHNSSRACTRQREEIMALLPYLQIAFKTHRELVRQRELAERMEFIFANAPTPRALVRSDLRIVLANRAFIALTTDNPDICISDGEFDIRNAALYSQIHEFLDPIISGRLDQKVFWVRNGTNSHGWLVSLATSTRNGHSSIPFKPAIALPERVALLSIRELGRNDSLKPDAVRAVLGLSATEASLACALANGESSTEIAQARQVSKNTVHNQLASAMNRLGLHRQMQMQNLLSLLSGFI